MLYTGYRYGWGPRQVGFSLAVVGLTTAIVQGGLSRRIIPLLGDVRSLVVGFAVSTLSMVAYGAATQGWMIYAILPIGAFGGIGSQSTQALVSRSVGPSEQGSIQGALTSLGSIAGFIAPLLATALFGHFVRPDRPVPIPGISFFVGTTLMALALALAVRTLRHHHHPPRHDTAR